MRSVVSSACSIALFLCLGFFSVDKVCLFHETYTVRAQELRKEEWLLDQCKDMVFFSNMGEHTSLCTEVDAKARIGAFWYALNRVSGSLPFLEAWEAVTRASWPILAGVAAVFILFPSAVVAYARTHASGGEVYRDYEYGRICKPDPSVSRYPLMA